MSINLTATNQKLKVITSQAVQTQVVASGRDNTTAGQTPISQDTNIPTATTTDVVAVPGASTQRLVDDVEISVVGGGTQNVTVQKDVGGTVFQLFRALLGSGERAHFTNDMGWRVFGADGSERTVPVGYSQMAAPTAFAVAGAYTYSPPIGCTALLIELWGGASQGGGAATAASSASAGTGGNTGGVVRKFLIGVPASITGSIGAAGSGAGTGANGAAGGNTTAVAGALTLTATGGNGGVAGAAGTTAATTTAAAAVSGTNGDENLPGMQGDSGLRITGLIAISGEGGLYPGLGNPGAKLAAAGTGAAATGNCAAGGGGLVLNASAAVAGGPGTPGYARFTPYSG